MTIDTLRNEFTIGIKLDESNRLMGGATPSKSLGKAGNPVTPDNTSSGLSVSSELSPSGNLSVNSYERLDSNDFPGDDILVSEHKKAELAGLHADEPLMKENPRRYVLFPIEDAEVSKKMVYNPIEFDISITDVA